MKSESEIREALNALFNVGDNEFKSMSYKDGLEEALLWALGEISDDEFTLTNRK